MSWKLLFWAFPVLLFASCDQLSLSSREFDSKINDPIVRYKEDRDVAYGKNPYQRVDVFYPESAYGRPSEVMIMIHGGNWFYGDKWFLQPSVDEVMKARKNLTIVNINYTITVLDTRKTMFEQQMADIDSCVSYLRKNVAKYNIRADRFAIMGASAGAHLALSYAYTQGKRKIHTVLGMSAITELASAKYLTPTLINDIKGLTGYDERKKNEEVLVKASPVHLASADVPRTILLYGLDDGSVAVRQQTLLRERLLALKVPNSLYTLKGQGHNVEAKYVAETILGGLGADEYDLYSEEF